MTSLLSARNSSGVRSLVLSAALIAAVFVAVLVQNLRLAGTSPIAWMDTIRDEIEVQRCLVSQACTLTGMTTELPGLVSAVGWLQWRTLLAWLGFSLESVHLLVQIANAVGVVILFHLATRLGGRLAGVASVCILIFGIGPLSRWPALYSTNPLLFLGSVMVLICTAVVERPGALSVSLAALVGALMANIHLAGLMTGPSVVWAALWAPRRRLLLAVIGAVVFAAAALLAAPAMWLRNVTGLAQMISDAGSVRHGTPPVIFSRNPLWPWIGLAVVCWLFSLVKRTPPWSAYRRNVQGALAVIAPVAIAYLIAPWLGLNAGNFLMHLGPACAVAAGVPIGLVVGAAGRRLSTRWVLRPLEVVLPLAAAVMIARPGASSRGTADDATIPTMRDLAAVNDILRSEHGWSAPQLSAHLKSLSTSVILTGVLRAAPSAYSGAARTDGAPDAILVCCKTADLPDPLPPGWQVVSQSDATTTVLVFTSSSIDWSQFEVCVLPEGENREECQRTIWQLDEPSPRIDIPHMPLAGRGWRGRLSMRLPLRSAGEGVDRAIFMPRRASMCAGRIVAADGPVVIVDERHASIPAAPAGGSPATITLAWDIGSPACPSTDYDGLPPFFVDADVATARLLEPIFRQP